MKVNDKFETRSNACPWTVRLIDKVFVELWQTSRNIDEVKDKREDLFAAYKECHTRFSQRQKDKHRLPKGPLAARATWLRKKGVALKKLKHVATPNKPAEYYKGLDRYAQGLLRRNVQ